MASGHFFTISAQAAEQIAAGTKSWEAVLAYLTLAKHRQKETQYTTGGANVVAKKLCISRYRAGQLLRDIASTHSDRPSLQLAVVSPDTAPEGTAVKERSAATRRPLRELPDHREDPVYLPNSLIDGTKEAEESSPFQCLTQIEPKSDRLPLIQLLLKLYQYHSLPDYGGVDPKVVRREWATKHLGEQGIDSYTALHFWRAERQPKCSVDPTIVGAITNGDQERFWQLFDRLAELRFFYEVAMVFDEDPKESSSAELWYPLYTFDRLVREQESEKGLSGVALDIQDCFRRSRIVQEHGVLSRLQTHSETGLFIFAGTSSKAKLVSVFRLRFRPHTLDTGDGFARESERVKSWRQRFERAFQRTII